MSDILERIKTKFKDAVVKLCSERGCTLCLTGLKNYVVLKGERICQSGKICDRVILKEDAQFIIGIVELKSKTIYADEIVEKITNSLKSALHILKSCSDKHIKPKFYQIILLVLCKRRKASEFRVITSKKVTIEGKDYPIRIKQCGFYFSKLISTRS